MHGAGFAPTNPLRDSGLNAAGLTTSLPVQKKQCVQYKLINAFVYIVKSVVRWQKNGMFLMKK